MTGLKSSIYQIANRPTLFTNQLALRNCHKMTICEEFRTKCCVNLAATLTLAITDVFSIKNMTRMLQQEGTSVLKNRRKMSFVTSCYYY